MKKVAGVDEVGRGSLVGPVYAAAVIFKKNIDKSKIKDSKKLSKEERDILESLILLLSIFFLNITAAAYTGPTKLPLPTSSTPATFFII